MEEMNGQEIDGKRVRVQYAKVTSRGNNKTERQRRFDSEVAERKREKEERAQEQEEREKEFQWYLQMKESGGLAREEEEIRRRSVFVGNTYDLTEDDLREAFMEYGVVDVRFPYSRPDGGYAHVEFESEQETTRALREMTGSKVRVRTQYIRVERPRGKRVGARSGGEEDAGARRFGEGG